MDLLPSAEQDEIAESSAAFLADRFSIEKTRELFEAGSAPAVDEAAWAAAAELGWFALGLPEECGGIGCGLADEALLFREIGRAVAPGPFLSTVLGARVAALGGDDALAAEIVNGRAVGMVVPNFLDVVGADGSLNGDVQLIDATAGLALVLMPNVAALIDVAHLTAVTSVACVDSTVLLQRASAASVAPIVAVAADVDPTERRAHVLTAAMLTGVTDWARDTSTEHAINRFQFDKPIGVNQAIKHPCADMAVQAMLAYSQTIFAAVATDEGRADAQFHALSANLTAASAAEFATGTTVQILGGMGFTHEHDTHLYLKRAEVLAQTLGGRSTQLERLLELPEPL
jgi:alkylation response protein AidB-like acyl-CoA dehydrogenase